MRFEVHNADCLEAMRNMADGFVECLITDPPYCAGSVGEAGRVAAAGQGLRSENLKRFGWFVGDNMTTAGLVWLLRAVAFEAVRVVAPGGSVLFFCDWKMLHTLAPAIESAGLRYQNLVVWDKGHFGMGTGFRCQHELVMHFTNGKPVYYDKATGNVLKDKRIGIDERQHQTQKPVELLKQLINVVCPPHGTVLDPFCGSGSTGVAALELERRFIGIERSKHHCLTAERRLQAVSPKLFAPSFPVAEQATMFATA